MKKFSLKDGILAGSIAFVSNPLFASGLNKANTQMQSIETALRCISVVTVISAVLWVGYKLAFGGATFREVAPILIGAGLIGGVTEIAKMLIQ